MIWIWWVVYAVVVLALAAAAYFLRPKAPPGPAPSTLDELQVPVAEEGKEIPVIFGTVDIEDPNVVWYGNFFSRPTSKSGGK